MVVLALYLVDSTVTHLYFRPFHCGQRGVKVLIGYLCVLQKVQEVDGERVVDDEMSKVSPESHVLGTLPNCQDFNR